MGPETRTVDGISRIGTRQWNRLDRGGNPFLDFNFLAALESSGSVAADNGWQPNHICIYEGDSLQAAAPSYIKGDSRGEFVFDWAWADGYHRHGLPYYPKLLTAVPWTPVTGPRLLVNPQHPDPGTLRKSLVEAALEQCRQTGMSTWHCNFVTPADLEALSDDELLIRRDYQFHWQNHAFGNFDEFLETLKSRKRKNIRHERRQVADAGIRFEHRNGHQLDADDIAFLHQCYRRTFHLHGNHPALTPGCFSQIITTMPDNILAVVGYRNEARLAMSLFLVGEDALFGRYWGTLEEFPGLHFEAAYYQGIEYCIRHGVARFESGAQGEHKIARGFEPVPTFSAHYIRHEGFRNAIADYLVKEAEWLEGYRGEIVRHTPFRQDPGG